MTDSTNHHDLPEGLSEADLLDWIEADARTRSAPPPGTSVARVEEALERLPRARQRLEAMRVDRAALGALPLPEAPSWVSAAILDEHERQSLLALTEMATGPALHGERQGVLAQMPGWFRPALAAAAVLLVAFALWQVAPMLLPAGGGRQGPAVAHGGGDGQPAGDAQSHDARAPADDSPPADRDASADAPVLADRSGQDGGAQGAAGPGDAADAPTPPLPSPGEALASLAGLPADELLEAARAGRLLLVVPVAAEAQAERLAHDLTLGAVDPAWRLRDASGELVAALTGPARVRAIGGNEAPHQLARDRGPLGRLELLASRTPVVYVADVALGAAGLLRLVEDLRLAGSAVRVVVADEPMPGIGIGSGGSAGAPPPGAPVLWWLEDPVAWRPWASVAVEFVPEP